MDRITNESNLWLNAIKMEDEGSYQQAFTFYLKDAEENIKQNSLVRAALSCSCAADCLVKRGALVAARQLYLQAATIYEKNANQVIGSSVREAIWSYQQAYEYFSMACEKERAQKAYQVCVSLARKTNPFAGEKEAMESLRLRALNMDELSNASSANMQLSAEIDGMILNFLKEIEPEMPSTDQPILKRIIHRFEKKDEKSINH